MKYKRIHILGGTGAGKTFLAEQYSKRYDIPVFELDSMVWENGAASDQRNLDERYRLLQSAVDSEKWIIEGVFYKWLSPSFEKAEKIIVLNTSKWLRLYRVMKRTLTLLLSKPKTYRSTISNCLKIIQFNQTYDQLHYDETLNILSNFENKVVICNDYRKACYELDT